MEELQTVLREGETELAAERESHARVLAELSAASDALLAMRQAPPTDDAARVAELQSELETTAAELAQARGALAVIDRRILLISADSIDLTADAIELIDQRLGDGAQP